MNATSPRFNHEVIGQHSSQSRGKTMNTKVIKDSRKRSVSLTMAGLLTAVMSSNAIAADVTANGDLKDNNDLASARPVLSTAECVAFYSVTASGDSNFPGAYKVFRDGAPVGGDRETASYRFSEAVPIQGVPTRYRIQVVNRNPSRWLRVGMKVSCT